MVLTVLYFYGLRRLIQETIVDDDLHLMCSGRQSGDIQLNFPISDRPAGILKYLRIRLSPSVRASSA